MRLLKNTGLESNSDGCASAVWDHVPSVFSLVPALTSCHVCEWITLILLLSLSFLTSSSCPSLSHGPAYCPLIILCSVTHWCLHSFVHSLRKHLRAWSHWSHRFTSSFYFYCFPKSILSWLLFLFIYQPPPASCKPLLREEDWFFNRTSGLFFTKASVSQQFIQI